jgi:hypothetical protein
VRYRLLLAGRSRAALVPAAMWLFVLAGVYAYNRNEVGSAYAITALLLCPLTAWLAVALSHAEPAPQRELLAAISGRGPVAGLAAGAAAVAAFAFAAGAVDVVWPIVTHAFARHVTAGDVTAAVLAHAGCAAYGAALGTLAGARMISRPGLAFTALAGVAIVAVPLFELAPALSPAAWAADALTDGGAIAAPAVALAVHTAAVVAVAAWALRRTA